MTLPADQPGVHGERTPLISVVLATYNRVHVLADTLRMVLAQTLDDFELIVCDDASTDGTPAVIAEWAARDPRIRHVRQPRNLGLAGNVSRGIAMAEAELVAVLYDGDVYDSRLLERWAAALRACPEAAFVFNAYNRLGPDGRIDKTYGVRLDSCVPGRVVLERLYFRRWHFTSPVWGTVMLRKSKYVAVGGLNPRFSPIADVDLYLRLAEASHVAYIPDPLVGMASRETVPKLFRPASRRIVRQVLREARIRHYQGRPFRLRAEMLRYRAFAAVDVVVGPVLAAVSGWQRPTPAYRLRRRLTRWRSASYMTGAAAGRVSPAGGPAGVQAGRQQPGPRRPAAVAEARAHHSLCDDTAGTVDLL